MPGVDERVVDMQFNNKQFEQGVQTTLKSLDQLKNGLNFDGATKGLEELERTGRSFSLAGIGDGIEAIGQKFTALGVIGITTIQNLTNDVINFGKNLVSSLTIDPIKTGFSEYETKMGAITTILTNTQSTQKKVNQETVKEINQAAIESAAATKRANDAALESFKKNQELELREYTKNAKKELDVLKDKYEEESDALKDYIESETKLLNEAHKEKLSLYEEEYMSKLKAVDEERYNKLKAIDEEINSINDLTKAEEEQIKLAKQQLKLQELQNKVLEAVDEDARLDAEQNLAEYKDQLAREQLLKERDAQIEQLKLAKDNVNEEYDLIKANLKEEYDQKIQQENDSYSLEVENLKSTKEISLKYMKETYETERDLMQERQEEEKYALKEKQEMELAGLKNYHEIALKNIEIQKKAQLEALTVGETTKASTLEDVNKVLNELNEYADMTIYNFAEMTRNIGTFTAAGIGLEDSAIAIKGIANLAAGSGSTSQQASTAMYQLSQALASGTLKLQDWNSVVNAGMGGQLFQNALKQTAKELGITVNEFVPFRESLQDGWATSEVLIETLKKFADDESLLKAATQVKTVTQLIDTMKESVQSGWSMSWEYILGDKDQAAELLTSVNDAFGKLTGASADARNEMLKFWNENGGRDALIEGIKNAFEGLASILKPISDAFREIFPPLTGEKLVEISEKIRDFFTIFKTSDVTPILRTGEAMRPLAEGIRTVTEAVKMGDENAENLKNTFKGIFALVDIIGQIIGAIVTAAFDLVGALAPAGEGLLGVTGAIGEWLIALDEAAKQSGIFKTIFDKVVEVIVTIADKIKTVVTGIVDAFNDMRNADMSGLETFSEKVKARFEPLTKIGEALGKAFEFIKDVVKKIGTALAPVGEAIGEHLRKIWDKIIEAIRNADYNTLFDIVNGGIMAAIAIGFKKFIDSLTGITDNAGGFLEGLTSIFDGVKGSLEAWQSQLKAGTLLKIAIAVGILAASLVALSLIDSEKLMGALAGITVLFAELFGFMSGMKAVMGKDSIGGLGKVTTAMLGLSAAVLILSIAMKNISDLDWDGLTKGIIGIGALTATIVIAAKTLSDNEGAMVKGATSFVIFSAALLVLAEAVEKLGALDIASLGKGLLGVGVLMAELVGCVKLIGESKLSISSSVGMVALSAAILILAEAVERFGELDTTVLIKGLASLAIVLGELALFLNLTGGAEKVISTATGLTILSAAMLIMAEAVSRFGEMSWEQLGKGLLGVGAALAIVAGAMALMPDNMLGSSVALVAISAALLILAEALGNMAEMSWEQLAISMVALAGSLIVIAGAMQFMTGALPGAAAVLVIAAALAILAPVLQTFGSMSLLEIGKGLLEIAGIFAIFGAAGLILAPVVPVLLGLGAAMALLGVGMAGIGAGLVLLAAGISALALSGEVGAAALVRIVESLLDLIPLFFDKVAEGLLAFLRAIRNSIPELIEPGTELFMALVDCLIAVVPKAVDALFFLIQNILDAIVENLPNIMDAGMQILASFLEGIAKNIADVVKAAIDIVLEFIRGIGEKYGDVIDAAFELIINFINGLADAIRNNYEAIYDAIGNLITAIGEAVFDLGPKLVEIGKDIILGLIEGIKKMATAVWDAVKEVVGSAIDGIKDFLGIKSPSTVFADIGMNLDKGLAQGLTKFSGLVSDSAEDVGDTALSTLREAMSKVHDAINNDIDMQPTIRPVLDLTDIKMGGKKIDSILGGASINVSASRDRAMSIASSAADGTTPVGAKIPIAGASFNFEQNIYSPKPVSRLDIYRGTRNQFSALKGLVGG
jgi:tape measure domain-containing protein